MRCIALFSLESDLCLKAGAEPLVLNSPDNNYSLTLSNSLEKPDTELSAELVFEASSLDDAIELSKDILFTLRLRGMQSIKL